MGWAVSPGTLSPKRSLSSFEATPLPNRHPAHRITQPRSKTHPAQTSLPLGSPALQCHPPGRADPAMPPLPVPSVPTRSRTVNPRAMAAGRGREAVSERVWGAAQSQGGAVGSGGMYVNDTGGSGTQLPGAARSAAAGLQRGAESHPPSPQPISFSCTSTATAHPVPGAVGRHR